MPTRLDLPQRLDRLPVLLLGGVNLVRSLGLAGIPAVVATPNPQDPVFASRHCTGSYVLPAIDSSATTVDAIIAIGDRLSSTYGRRVPLVYGGDEYLELIHAHRERLERYFLMLLNDPEVAAAVTDKDRFQVLAQERGLPVPRTLAWDGDGPATVAGTPGPVVVKPRTKHDWYVSQVRQRLFGDAKARIYDSGAAAAADPGVVLFHDQLQFQEYVPGGDEHHWSFHALADEEGVVLESFVGRKLRTYPPGTGESAFIEIAPDEELSALGRDIAARLPLKGVFKMDFKKDERTGHWYLLEINARFNLWMYLGARNGLNLVRTTYDYLVDGTRPVAGRQPARTYRWLSLDLDFRAYRELRRRGELGLAGWLLSILLSRNVCQYFSWSDPGPWIRVWANRANRIWIKCCGRLATLLRQWRSTAS